MSQTVNMHKAKTHLSKLIEAVERGEEVTIARDGVPCARLVPIESAVRELGFMQDLIPPIPDDVLFAPLTVEELGDWEDGPVEPDVEPVE